MIGPQPASTRRPRPAPDEPEAERAVLALIHARGGAAPTSAFLAAEGGHEERVYARLYRMEQSGAIRREKMGKFTLWFATGAGR